MREREAAEAAKKALRKEVADRMYEKVGAHLRTLGKAKLCLVSLWLPYGGAS